MMKVIPSFNFLDRICITNLGICVFLLVMFGITGSNLVIGAVVLTIVTLMFLGINAKVKSLVEEDKLFDEEEKRAISKLRRDVLLWQTATTFEFSVFFIMMYYWGVKVNYLLYIGAYTFFTVMHIIFYVGWKGVIISAIREFRRTELLVKVVEKVPEVFIPQKVCNPIQYDCFRSLRRNYG